MHSRQALKDVKQTLGWSIALGVILIILGVCAIASPYATSLAVNIFVGWLFIFSGISQLIYAFQSRGFGPFILKLILSGLYFGIGVVLLRDPLAGALSLALTIGIFLLVDGICRVIMAFELKPLPQWGWVLANGMIMIVLGILVGAEWPIDAPWAIALFVGLGLISTGLSTLIFALLAHNALERLPQPSIQQLERT